VCIMSLKKFDVSERVGEAIEQSVDTIVETLDHLGTSTSLSSLETTGDSMMTSRTGEWDIVILST
jgi:hypothetical protein